MAICNFMFVRHAVLLSLVLSGCVSKKSGDIPLAEIIAGSGKTRGEGLVVVQSDGVRLSEHDRSHWISLRNDTKDNDGKRLLATLATAEWGVVESEAKDVLAKNPLNEGALLALSISLAMQRRYPIAAYYAQRYESLYKQNPATINIRALAVLTQSRVSLGDIKKATALFEEAFAADSREIASGFNLGHLNLEMGNADGALAIFEDCRRRCDDCAPALLGSGIAAMRLRKLQTARKSFERVLDIKKNDAQALYRLAQISYYGEKNKNQARSYVDRLFKTATPEDEPVRIKAEALVRAMDAEEDPSTSDDNGEDPA